MMNLIKFLWIKLENKRLEALANFGLMIKPYIFMFLKKKFLYFLRTQGPVKKVKSHVFNLRCVAWVREHSALGAVVCAYTATGMSTSVATLCSS